MGSLHLIGLKGYSFSYPDATNRSGRDAVATAAGQARPATENGLGHMSAAQHIPDVARRLLLPCLTALACMTAAGCSRPVDVTVGAASTVSYVLSCRKASGAFGAREATGTTLADTWHAVAALQAFEWPLPAPGRCAEHVRDMTPPDGAHAWWPHARLVTLLALGDSAHPGAAYDLARTQTRSGGWRAPGGDEPTLPATSQAVGDLVSLRRTRFDRESAARFVVERLYRDGSFRDTPREVAVQDSAATLPEADVLHAHAGITALHSLGYEVPWRRSVVTWLRSCQREDGGFAATPTSRTTDVWYTYLAVRALRTLGAAPADSAAAVEFINACQNADGGFGDRPGSLSRLASTRFAVCALRDLCGSATLGIHPKNVPAELHAAPEAPAGAIQHAYPGPLPGAKLRGERLWWPGTPVYLLPDSLDEIMRYVEVNDLFVSDSTLSTFLWQVPYPALPESVTTASVSFLVGTSSGPRVAQALRSAWDVHPIVSSGLGALVGRISRIMEGRRIAICLRLGSGDQWADYRAMDELLEQRLDNCALVVGYFDGTTPLDASPWLERLTGTMPCVLLIRGSGEMPGHATHMLWVGTEGDDEEFLDALSAAAATCPIGSMGPSSSRTFARPSAAEAVRRALLAEPSHAQADGPSEAPPEQPADSTLR